MLWKVQNINWVFSDLLQEDGRVVNSKAPTLLQLGSCELHVIHGAYKAGQEATDWKLAKVLRAFDQFLSNPQHKEVTYSFQMNYMKAMRGKKVTACFHSIIVNTVDWKMGRLYLD